MAEVIEVYIDHIKYTNESENTSFMTKVVSVNDDKFINEAEDANFSIPSNEVSNNPESPIRINKIVNQHNHTLSVEKINFDENKKFSPEILEDIKFLTSHCKFGATVQRKLLEGKYPVQLIHSKDLYIAIQKFQPTSKSLSNNASLMSSWLDNQKEIDSR
ncbi:15451_t:CDS:2 [Racocetra fulgida]|uniref:15451_t:CDS:1 n=1 Tax=Racocetra fulgida TaxID=60492 RepID=A0A9N9AKV8_9GLOM|nr:15451_t:CDS:2 [Racocetra fulgida]